MFRNSQRSAGQARGRSTRVPHESAIEDAETVKQPNCPLCGSAMVLRRATRGRNAGSQFWGCSQFSHTGCKGIVNLGQFFAKWFTSSGESDSASGQTHPYRGKTNHYRRESNGSVENTGSYCRDRNWYDGRIHWHRACSNGYHSDSHCYDCDLHGYCVDIGFYDYDIHLARGRIHLYCFRTHGCGHDINCSASRIHGSGGGINFYMTDMSSVSFFMKLLAPGDEHTSISPVMRLVIRSDHQLNPVRTGLESAYP